MALLTLQSSALVKSEKRIFDEMREMQNKGNIFTFFFEAKVVIVVEKVAFYMNKEFTTITEECTVIGVNMFVACGAGVSWGA